MTTAFATSNALAWYSCGSSYTVQWGDTLNKIANRCGTTVSALRLANPGIAYGYLIYPGQVLMMPGSTVNNGNGYTTYIVARGDTLKSIANRYGTTMYAIASLNGIYNYNWIYEGQRLLIPGSGTYYPAPTPVPTYNPPPNYGGLIYTVQWGDTLRIIAARMNTTVDAILAVNPQIWNPNFIFIGEQINLPSTASTYVVQPGDTLKIIAYRFNTSVNNLISLNPQIVNADWIYVGEVVRLW